MLTDSIREKVWTITGPYYSEHDWAHGPNHIKRVVRTALEIGKQEGVDLEVIELAAMLHDIFVNKETHSAIEGFRHEIEGAKEAKKILEKLGEVEETITAVCHCIQSHRKRAGTEPRTLEAKCLFDADMLDCIGAIGIIRSAFISFDHKQEFYRDEDIESYKRKNTRQDGTIIDFSKHSSNLEYDLSLKHVAGRMQTRTGKKLAKERADFMDEFYKRLSSEMKGTV